ncbi:MAG: TetR/AcrR family transcriptional regulator [Clostridiales bacterium]|nr:TetR/AcrR family transcriptional regulator [Clostridiales bacterium]
MGNAEETKQKIINETIQMIKETDGAVEQITIRKIAERTNIGVGLINHYFHSKDELIVVCVQSIIQQVVHSYRPSACNSKDSMEITKFVAKEVMDFLMENKQISKVSILADMKSPKTDDNTMNTARGFFGLLSIGKSEATQKQNKEEMWSAFLLTSMLQSAFLRKDILNDSIGVNWNDKQQRDEFIDFMFQHHM